MIDNGPNFHLSNTSSGRLDQNELKIDLLVAYHTHADLD